jgi:hypothetical protein
VLVQGTHRLYGTINLDPPGPVVNPWYHGSVA